MNRPQYSYMSRRDDVDFRSLPTFNGGFHSSHMPFGQDRTRTATDAYANLDEEVAAEFIRLFGGSGAPSIGQRQPRNYGTVMNDPPDSGEWNESYEVFSHLMFLYHNNIHEFLGIMPHLMPFVSRIISHRRGVNVLDAMVQPFFRTMQEYSGVMHQSLEVLNHLYQANRPIPGSSTAPPAAAAAAAAAESVPGTAPVATDASASATMGPGPIVAPLPTHIFQIPIPVPLHEPNHQERFVQFVTPHGHGQMHMFPPPLQFHIPADMPAPHVPHARNHHMPLTQEQIRRTTINYVFREPGLADASGDTAIFVPQQDQDQDAITMVCPISLERFHHGDVVTQIRHCGHTFHSAALYYWFARNSRCPMCRHNLSEDPSGNTPRPRPRSTSEPFISTAARPVTPPSATDLSAASLPTGAVHIPIMHRLHVPEPHDREAAMQTEVQQWITTLLSNVSVPSGFSNVDMDITYSVEYDASGNTPI